MSYILENSFGFLGNYYGLGATDTLDPEGVLQAVAESDANLRAQQTRTALEAELATLEALQVESDTVKDEMGKLNKSFSEMQTNLNKVMSTTKGEALEGLNKLSTAFADVGAKLQKTIGPDVMNAIGQFAFTIGKWAAVIGPAIGVVTGVVAVVKAVLSKKDVAKERREQLGRALLKQMFGHPIGMPLVLDGIGQEVGVKKTIARDIFNKYFGKGVINAMHPDKTDQQVAEGIKKFLLGWWDQLKNPWIGYEKGTKARQVYENLINSTFINTATFGSGTDSVKLAAAIRDYNKAIINLGHTSTKSKESSLPFVKTFRPWESSAKNSVFYWDYGDWDEEDLKFMVKAANLALPYGTGGVDPSVPEYLVIWLKAEDRYATLSSKTKKDIAETKKAIGKAKNETKEAQLAIAKLAQQQMQVFVKAGQQMQAMPSSTKSKMLAFTKEAQDAIAKAQEISQEAEKKVKVELPTLPLLLGGVGILALALIALRKK